MKLAIFGSRTLCDKRVEETIQKYIDELQPNVIITSGETSGVNEIARAKARENKITLTLEFANNKKYAQGKYEKRSIAILKQADMALFIHDGNSKGTRNELIVCKKMNVPFTYVYIDYQDDEDITWSEANIEWD
jgi:hypothetical protein